MKIKTRGGGVHKKRGPFRSSAVINQGGASGLCMASLGPVTRRESRDEMRSRWRVTRRDETRDGLALFVSRPKLTRRDEIRDTVHKNFFSIIQNPIFCNFEVTFCARDQKYFARWSRETESRDETRSRRSRLVSSRLFSRRDRLVTGPNGYESLYFPAVVVFSPLPQL